MKWFRIIIDGCRSSNTITVQRIMQLQTCRRWCLTFPGETRMLDMANLVGLWNVVPKLEQNMVPLKQVLELITYKTFQDDNDDAKNKNPPFQLHYICLPPTTLQRVNSFCHKIASSNCQHKSKYLKPILHVLSSGEEVNKAKLWDIMYTDKIWPEYKYLPIAVEPPYENSTSLCFVCFSDTSESVQLQCRHVLCIRCTNLLIDCPLCRRTIEQIYKPKLDTLNSHLAVSNDSETNVYSNEKTSAMIKVLETLLSRPKRRIVMVFNGFNLLNVKNFAKTTTDVRSFEEDDSYRILLVSCKTLQDVHISKATDLLLGFPLNPEKRLCTCSPNLDIHVFLFQNTIEQLIYEKQGTLSPKHKVFWDKLKNFIDFES